ncbi:MAG: DNA-directed RNA polymerase subunit beta' [bacterium]|nr:DNA-directed RNA polymerase subunit beta' [bacterium]
MRVQDIEAIRIKLASPEDILGWSRGEVQKSETINYRTQRPEKDGLFCEKIFGPTKDFECYCGKYKRIRYKGVVCDRCGVEVTKAQVRRERIGHIKLATPCSHIWFLRGIPSRLGMVLDLPMQQLEKVIYFAAYIVISVNEDARKKVLEEIEKEYKAKLKVLVPAKTSVPIARGTTVGKENPAFVKASVGKEKQKTGKINIGELNAARNAAKEELLNLKPSKILSETEYHRLSLKYGEVFTAGTGAEVLRKTLEKIDIKKQIDKLKEEAITVQPAQKRKILTRLRMLQGMQKVGIKPEWMFLTVLSVLPPDLRPMVQLDGGRYASSDLNDLYRRVINRNNRLKYLLEIGAPEVIVRNEKRMLQEAVDALIDNGMRKGTTTTATTGGKRLLKSLADILKGKQGRFRQNLLGKRVDYSGRSVIVVGPDLKFDQVGLPKKMALELFKPFVIKRILDKELAYNVRGASRLIEEETDEVWAILEEVVKEKLILLNRAPTLHRLGIQAFYPLLIEGEVIQLHPLACKAFNADFDGDQMAVHVPLSDMAQKEAREIMLSSLNFLKPATGLPVVTPYQDAALGCFWLTRLKEGAKGEGKIFGSSEEALLAIEFGDVYIKAKIKVRIKVKEDSFFSTSAKASVDELVETSAGRIIFNSSLPNDYPFQNSEIKSKDLEKMVSDIYGKYPIEKVKETLDAIKEIGFEYSTFSGVSWGMDDLIIPPQKGKIMAEAEKEIEKITEHFKRGLLSKEEKSNRVIEIWNRVKTEIEILVPKTLPKDGSVFQIIESGAKGSWSQPVQMAGMKGLVINPAGQIIELPVKSSFKEGLAVLEYFISTHGARKGTADTALRTSTAGYLTRRLVDVAHDVVTTEEDCGDEEGKIIFRKEADDIGQNFVYKILGRVAMEKVQSPNSKDTIVKSGEVIDWKIADEIVKAKIEKVKVRSILSCKTMRGVCQKCYGWDLGSNKLVKLGEAVGIVAAQSIGEPGTQLTMRTFHTGGVAGGDITFGLPRVQEVFEARVPGGKAEIAIADGKVLEITPERIIRVKAKGENLKSKGESLKAKGEMEKGEISEYKIPVKTAILVAVGQDVKAGQPLCEGSLDLKDLFRLVGKDETQRYIVKEIQKIYVSQGALIHDKHIEVICCQMFSRLRIKDSGDSKFSSGEIIEKSIFLEENARLKKENKKPAKEVQILLGISRVSLTTDSFLSSASFQETSRVLIKGALEGKEDRLRGLKENVIIGKLIPVGTGFRK